MECLIPQSWGKTCRLASATLVARARVAVVYAAPVEEVFTRTLDAAGMSAARIYAALRAKAPGRTSFLIETGEPGQERSTIGFLTKSESAYPPAADLLGELLTLAGQICAAEPPGDLASACLRDDVLLVAFDAVLPVLGVAPWPDQPFGGRLIRGVTSIVHDASAGTITIVATNPNVVERCARTIASAPALSELPPPGASKPEYLTETPPDAAFAKQLGRAERRLALGGVERLLLPRTFKTQPSGADPFDVYRALREAGSARHGFFVEMPASQMFSALTVAATGDAFVRVAGASPADPAAVVKEMLALFPIEGVAGVPSKEALTALRDLDAGSRGMHGGMFVRIRPGGDIELFRADLVVTFEEEQLQVRGAAPVVTGRDAAAHTVAVEQGALAALTAIRRAQDAAAAREAAAALEAAVAPEAAPSGAESE
jgi:anthranilate synthase component 1